MPRKSHFKNRTTPPFPTPSPLLLPKPHILSPKHEPPCMARCVNALLAPPPPPLSLSPQLSLWHTPLSLSRSLSPQLSHSHTLTLSAPPPTPFWVLQGQNVGCRIEEQLLRRNVKRFRGGLVFKAHRLVYHSTLVLKVRKKKMKIQGSGESFQGPEVRRQNSGGRGQGDRPSICTGAHRNPATRGTNQGIAQRWFARALRAGGHTWHAA